MMKKKSTYFWQQFHDKAQLADDLAVEIAQRLQLAIKNKNYAVLALSGGSTPLPLLQRLSLQSIDWANVVVTLVDERCVPVSNTLSNAAMLQKELIDNVQAGFIPLFYEGISLSDSILKTQQTLMNLHHEQSDALPIFDVCILGMGSDGHSASFFPDANNIQHLVDNPSQQALQLCESGASQVQRVTWSVSQLLRSEFLALHFTGEEKKRVFLRACDTGPVAQLPIRFAIAQNATPLQVYYSDDEKRREL